MSGRAKPVVDPPLNSAGPSECFAPSDELLGAGHAGYRNNRKTKVGERPSVWQPAHAGYAG